MPVSATGLRTGRLRPSPWPRPPAPFPQARLPCACRVASRGPARRSRWRGAGAAPAQLGLSSDTLINRSHLTRSDARSDFRATTLLPCSKLAYRLLMADGAGRAGGWHSATEFDLGPLTPATRGTVELGRSCVAGDFRSGGVTPDAEVQPRSVHAPSARRHSDRLLEHLDARRRRQRGRDLAGAEPHPRGTRGPVGASSVATADRRPGERVGASFVAPEGGCDGRHGRRKSTTQGSRRCWRCRGGPPASPTAGCARSPRGPVAPARGSPGMRTWRREPGVRRGSIPGQR